MPNTVLLVNSSARFDASASRALANDLARRLAGPAGRILDRDVGKSPSPSVSEAWVEANFTAEQDRTPEQVATLAVSDSLVSELEAADQIVIGVPVYNFAIPAALKAWIDQVARARRTFRYTAEGPEGLLKGKTAYLVMASGGTGIDSELDFATPYLRHLLGFLGITDVRIIAADRLMSDGASKLAAARTAIEQATAGVHAP